MFADLSETALSDGTFVSDMNISDAAMGEAHEIFLPRGFDISRASEWTGGSPAGTSVTGSGGNRITYSYDCGNGIIRTFFIHVKSSHTMAMPADTISFCFGEDAALRLSTRAEITVTAVSLSSGFTMRCWDGFPMKRVLRAGFQTLTGDIL